MLLTWALVIVFFVILSIFTKGTRVEKVCNWISVITGLTGLASIIAILIYNLFLRISMK